MRRITATAANAAQDLEIARDPGYGLPKSQLDLRALEAAADAGAMPVVADGDLSHLWNAQHQLQQEQRAMTDPSAPLTFMQGAPDQLALPQLPTDDLQQRLNALASEMLPSSAANGLMTAGSGTSQSKPSLTHRELQALRGLTGSLTSSGSLPTSSDGLLGHPRGQLGLAGSPMSRPFTPERSSSDPLALDKLLPNAARVLQGQSASSRLRFSAPSAAAVSLAALNHTSSADQGPSSSQGLLGLNQSGPGAAGGATSSKDMGKDEWEPRVRRKRPRGGSSDGGEGQDDSAAEDGGRIKAKSMTERQRRDRISDALRRLRSEINAHGDMASMLNEAVDLIQQQKAKLEELEMQVLQQRLREQLTGSYRGLFDRLQ